VGAKGIKTKGRAKRAEVTVKTGAEREATLVRLIIKAEAGT